MFLESFKGVSKVFQGSFKKTFKVSQKISCYMALIAASRAEGGLVFIGPIKFWRRTGTVLADIEHSDLAVIAV